MNGERNECSGPFQLIVPCPFSFIALIYAVRLIVARICASYIYAHPISL